MDISLKKIRFIKSAACAAMLSIMVLVGGFVIRADAPKKITLSGFESSKAVTWHDESVTVGESTDIVAEGEKSVSLNMKHLSNWKGVSVAFEKGKLADASAIVFYFKAPTGPTKNNCWFQLFYEYEGVQITHGANFKIYLCKKGQSKWTETDYWANYGPNIPYKFEGYIKIPLTQFLKVSYTTTGETEPKMDLVDKVLFFFSNFGGTKGTIYLDDLYAETGTESFDGNKTVGCLQVLEDFEGYSADATVQKTNDNPGGIISFTANPRDFEALISQNTAGDGKNAVRINSLIEQNFAQMLFSFSRAVSKEAKSVIMYVKAPQVSKNKEFNFTIGALVAGGDYKLNDCNIYIMKRGKNSWETAKYIADWGAALNGGFEGYIQFSFDDFVVSYNADKSNPIPEKIVPQSVSALNFWVHNFGGDDGEESCFYFDTVLANTGSFDTADIFSLIPQSFFTAPEITEEDDVDTEWLGDPVDDWIEGIDVSPAEEFSLEDVYYIPKTGTTEKNPIAIIGVISASFLAMCMIAIKKRKKTE